MPVISAIVPAHNEAEWIETTLLTLKNLNCVDEIIVVDDGSRDKTGKIRFSAC